MIENNETLLIIGEGTTEYLVNEIVKINTKSKAELYGIDSDIYHCFCDAQDIGAKNIYILNMMYYTDYPLVVNALVQNDFTYIVPTNGFLSSTIIAKLHRTTKKFVPEVVLDMQKDTDEYIYKEMYLGEYLLANIRKNNKSTIFMTDIHASLYENIDAFIDDMESKIKNFKRKSFYKNAFGRNLCFVSSNLRKYRYGNVVAASMLCSSNYNKYPKYDCGDSIFDIDKHDVKSKEFVFFKYNIVRETTLENFHNFRVQDDSVKFVPIDRCIKYIERHLDLSEFCGKLYNDYLRMAIVEALNIQLESMRNIVLRDFCVTDCKFVKHKNFTVTVLNAITVVPINSLESYRIEYEVQI